jgi:anti-sigma B factor antagonist
MPLEINESRIEPDITVLHISGRLELGGESQRLEELVAWLVGDGRLRVLLDLTQVDYIDSAGIGALAMIGGQVKHAGGRLALLVREGRVKRVLQFARLDEIMSLAETVEQAVARLISRSPQPPGKNG